MIKFFDLLIFEIGSLGGMSRSHFFICFYLIPLALGIYAGIELRFDRSYLPLFHVMTAVIYSVNQNIGILYFFLDPFIED